MSERDEQWFDALAGRHPPADAQEQRLQHAIRKAAQRDAGAQPDEMAERRLLQRLESEGLLSVEADESQQRRITWPRLAQAAVIVLCVGVVFELTQAPFLSEPASTPKQAPLEQAAQREVATLASESESENFAAKPPAVKQPTPALAASQSEEHREVAELADSAVARLQDRAVAPTLPRAFAKRSEAALVWVKDIELARQQLERWQVQTEQASKQPNPIDRDLLALRCDSNEACAELSDLLDKLGAEALSQQVREGQWLYLRLRHKP